MTDRTNHDFSLDELLHPASAFGHPCEVVSDSDLTLNEKRAILASWASDACTIEAAELRARPKGPPVRFDDIMDALRTLDKQANGDKYRRVLRRRRVDRIAMARATLARHCINAAPSVSGQNRNG